jgi:hypothetical protein
VELKKLKGEKIVMDLVRWGPLNELENMHEAMDKLWEDTCA